MARKRTMNYRELRTDFAEGEEQKREDVDDEAEDEEEDEDEDEEASGEEEPSGDEEASDDEDSDDEDAPKKKKKVVKKKVEKPKVVRAKKPRASKVVRLRVVWGVFDNANKRIEIYDYNKKNEAEEHMTRLQTDKKQTYFIQPVKIPLEEPK